MWRSPSRFTRDIQPPQIIGAKPGALRREVIIVALVKIALLAILKAAFFSAPSPKGPEAQVQHLLGSVASPVSITQGKTS